MSYETSYDSGRLPYAPDLARGYWTKSSDFILTGISLAFRLDVFSISWVLFAYDGCASVIPYVTSLFLFIVPLFVMQSFLGQFSSSGFISVFRISPLFKGIGYISLALNLGVLTYYSVFAAVPLLYFFHSLRPTLPWSCEGIKDWSYNFTQNEVLHLCHILSKDKREEYDDFWIITHEIPSNLFLKSRFNHKDLFDSNSDDFYISWEVLLCTLLTWALISALFYKYNSVEKLSAVLRYGIFTVFALLLISVTRFALVPKHPWHSLLAFFLPSLDMLINAPTVGIFVVSTCGLGWGTIISLASFNRFKTKIIRKSWTICFGQMLIFFCFAYIIFVTDIYYDELKNAYRNRYPSPYISKMWVLFLSTGSVMADMSWPNLWCLLYYAMLLLTGLITITVSLLSIMQSIFDEFERFRERKTEVTLIVIAILCTFSLYTCTNKGVFLHVVFTNDTIVAQTALNLLLFFVVLWIYGRVRFQRDLEFMIDQRFSTCKIYMLRFVSPLCLIILLLAALFIAIVYHHLGTTLMHIAAVLFVVLPWLYVPGYMVYILLRTTGNFKTRLTRCCHPMDWYPVELEERRRYEQTMRNTDRTEQLNPLEEERVETEETAM